MVFINVWSGRASWRREKDEQDSVLDGTYSRKSRESMMQE